MAKNININIRRPRKKVGWGMVLFHIFMTLITSGLWLIPLVIIHMRRNR